MTTNSPIIQPRRIALSYTHYVEYRSVAGVNGYPHAMGQFRGVAILVDILHSENVRRLHGGLTPIAIAFPDLPSKTRNKFSRVRVFSDFDTLTKFKRMANFTNEEPSDVLSVSDVRVVPENHGFLAFVRDRDFEKESQAKIDRDHERAQRKMMKRIERGEKIINPPMSTEERILRMFERMEETDKNFRTFIRVRSRSTRKGFSLFIKAVFDMDNNPGAVVDSYGLSRENACVAVPHF